MSGALLSILIPGDGDFPAAGDVGVSEAMARHDRFGEPLAQVTALLPPDFATLPPAQAIAAVQAIEADHPALFSRLIVGAYSLYYTHPDVADVIERLTGHTARPPQPLGHDLAPFDPALVAIPAARAPQYRPTPESEDAP